MDMVTNGMRQVLPTRELLVLNDMVDSFRRGMVEYQVNMNLPDREMKFEKTTDQYTTVTLINFNDNDLMLFGFFFYRSMLNTAAILATPSTN